MLSDALLDAYNAIGTLQRDNPQAYAQAMQEALRAREALAELAQRLAEFPQKRPPTN
jgi:hypothetical protein